MRYWVGFISTVLFLLTSTAYSKEIKEKPNSRDQSDESKKEYSFSFIPFDKKNLYFNVSALYALMTDNGVTTTDYAETLTAASPSDFTSYIPGSSPNWGYEVQLGYKFDPLGLRYAAIDFMSVATSGTNTTSVASQSDVLFNRLTQLGTALTGGFSSMNGPATATAADKIQYDDLSTFVARPYSDDGGTKIKFYKILGFKGVHMSKSLVAKYTGLVPTAANQNVLTPAQDHVNYGAEYYGVGGEGGLGGYYKFNEKVLIRGGFSASLLAGYYSSSLTEEASSVAPVSIGEGPATSFNTSEQHKTQAWTPFIARVNASVIWDLVKDKKTGFRVGTEGGIAAVYVLPTFTDDSYTPTLGQALFRFNNSVNLVYAFIRLNMNLD